jgi:DHA2 family methylenomycin A resistance protein-like MFS transporter
VQETALRATRGTVATAFLAMVATYVTLSSFEFVLVDMQLDLGFSTDDANSLAYTPAAASLLVVFIAGALADRWGPRRLLVIASLLFTMGAVLVGLAPSTTWVTVGRTLDGIGGVTMAIVGLSVINSTVKEPARRARVFGVYAAVTPAVFMFAPPMSALIVESFGWRAGVIPWVILGVCTLIATIVFVPASAPGVGRELVTPLLAGLVLAGIALGMTSLPTNRDFAAISLAVAASSLALIVIAFRRMSAPSLDLRWCRGRGMYVLLIALAVTSMPNLFFYTNLMLQYRYSVPLVLIALLLIIPQAFAVAGGLLSGPVSARIGPERSAAAALGVSALMCLGSLIVTPASPIWVSVLALTLSAAPIAFVVGPMTDTLLSRAPESASGMASSIRKATWTLGGVLGGALIGALSFGAFQSRLTAILEADGVNFDEAILLSREIRDGAVVDELAARLSDPIAREALIAKGPALVEAQSYSFAVMGLLSAGIYLAAAVLMFIYLRRRPG